MGVTNPFREVIDYLNNFEFHHLQNEFYHEKSV